MNSVILPRFMALIAMVVFLVGGRVAPGFASEIDPFVGEYEGSADMVSSDGTSVPRDMSVSISETKDGFNVAWVTTTYKADGRTKENAYSVDFLPTDRDGIYSADHETQRVRTCGSTGPDERGSPLSGGASTRIR